MEETYMRKRSVRKEDNMRKYWGSLSAIVLSLLAAQGGPVYAGGLSGIELQNGKETSSGSENSLPDPYEISGDYGILNQKDYEYEEGYVCEVYEYPVPDDITWFVKRYQNQAEKEDYTVSECRMEGYDACEISDEQYSAYLIFMPDEGSMLFLVEQGMQFELEKKPLTLEEIAESDEFLYPVENYAEVTVDGKKETFYLAQANTSGSSVFLTYYSYLPTGAYKHCLNVHLDYILEEGETYPKDYSTFYIYRSYSPYGDSWTDYSGLDGKNSDFSYTAEYVSSDVQSFQVSGKTKIFKNGISRRYEAENVEFFLDYTIGESNAVYEMFDEYWEDIYDTTREK